MPDPFPSCFGEYGVQVADSSSGPRMSQNLVTCLYQTKLAGHCRFVNITWCKNLIGQGLSVIIDDPSLQYGCKVELRPWLFWKKQGCKSINIEGRKVEVYWDLATAKYVCGPEPQESFYVAIVSEKEVVLLLGDMQKEAYKRIKGRPPSIEATLLCRREHLFGKKYFTTKAQFGDNGKTHEIMIECQTGQGKEPKLYVRIDRKVAVQVKRLTWKFRGNQTIVVDGQPVEVFWDVHNWLFNPSVSHAVFMFQACHPNEKPWLRDLPAPPGLQWPSSFDMKDKEPHLPQGFALFLYAWRNEK